MEKTNGQASLEFSALWKRIVTKMEAAAEEAGAGYDARVGEHQVTLSTPDEQQQLVFRRRGDMLEVVFVNHLRLGKSTSDHQRLHAIVPFRLSNLDEAYIALWLEAYGPSAPAAY